MAVIVKRLFYRGTGSGGTGGDASDIAYDNSGSGLPATNVQQAIDIIATKLDGSESSFATADWQGPDVDGNYVLLFSNTDHGKAKPVVGIYEQIGADFEQVEVMVTLDTSSNIKISVPASPDLRFTGKIIIS